MSETKNFKDKRSGRFKRASCDGGVEQETDTCEGIHNGAPPHMPSVSSFNFVAGILIAVGRVRWKN